MSWLHIGVLLALGFLAHGGLDPPERSSKILMLLPFGSKSHRNIFMSLAEGLALRGHKVVILSNHPPLNKHENIHEIRHGIPEPEQNLFHLRNTIFFDFFDRILPVIAREIYKLPSVKHLYEKRMNFDLIIVNAMFNELAYPFVHNTTFITLSTGGLLPVSSAVMGNVLHLAYVGGQMESFATEYDFPARLRSFLLHTLQYFFWRKITVLESVQQEISAQFPDLPPLLEIERNLSLTLMNSHYSFGGPVPLLPNQVEVGAMHCRRAKPLPDDILSWIEGAEPAGAVYFSLGSYIKGSNLPEEFKALFIESFGKIKQRVIWKFEEDIQDLPSNVLIRKWLPQQDLLAHPNVKVFITHAGLLSIQEAIYHGTPIMCIPISGDQHGNADKVEKLGFGKSFIWEDLSVSTIINAIDEITSGPRYRDRILVASRAMNDQSQTPLERAIWWTEYVIRHKGAEHLRCPAAKLSWVEFLMLDVLLFLEVVVLLVFFVTVWLIKMLIRSLLKGKGGSEKKKKL